MNYTLKQKYTNALTAQLAQKQKDTRLILFFIALGIIYNFDDCMSRVPPMFLLYASICHKVQLKSVHNLISAFA